MIIEIKYYVDNSEWSDGRFEDEPERTFVIDMNMLSNILRTFGDLKSGEFVQEVEVNSIPM